jgi:hypothetical protein
MGTVTLSLEEYERLLAMANSVPQNQLAMDLLDSTPKPKTKRRVSAYNRRYKKAFKKIAPRYKLKSGKWRAGGFKRAVKAAHKEAKK